MRQHPKAESGQHLHKMGLETLSAAQAVSGEIRVAAALLVSVRQNLSGARLDV